MACLKPAVELFVQQLLWPTTVGLARLEALKSLVHHSIMVEFIYPTKSSNRWAVGQAYRQSESSQRAHPADDPRQHSVPKKPEKVSCEEPHKFLQFVNILFFITDTQKIWKTSCTSCNSKAEQRITE